MPYLRTVLFAITTSFMPIILSLLSPTHSKASAGEAKYQLFLSFTPGITTGTVTGTAKITIPAGQAVSLSLTDITVSSALQSDKTGENKTVHGFGNTISLPILDYERTLLLSYSKTVENGNANMISPDGISLMENWYPKSLAPMSLTLTATLPHGFTAICESDTFPLRQQGATVTADIPQKTTDIHFLAGPYTVKKLQTRANLYIYSLFFHEDTALAEEYLAAASQFIARYEGEIGPYPYSYFAIVATKQPLGLSFPAFTTIGQSVLRLPFIKDTSLGHEILHSWFGNSVATDPNQGNWCEGLTTFLADAAYREDKGDGVADRHERIVRYQSLIPSIAPLTLADFTSAAHNQPLADVVRAVGYNRGALFFHELKEKLGDTNFRAGLRQFYNDYHGKIAGWQELEQTFSQASHLNLQNFFDERLHRKDIPELTVQNVTITPAPLGFQLNFDLAQNTPAPYSIDIPICIETISGKTMVTVNIHDRITPVAIPLQQRPLTFTIDPNHDFLRKLSQEEYPAVWSRIAGSNKVIAVLARESDRGLYQSLLESLPQKWLTVTTAENIDNRQLATADLLFLGWDQPSARALFGPPVQQGTLTIDIRHNPLNPEYVAALVVGANPDNTGSLGGRLSHYGSYSFIKLAGKRGVEKKIETVTHGLKRVLEELPSGGATEQLSPFSELIEKMSAHKVVYVGESHTEYADHLLQLRIIEALYRKNPNLAIGMEMFPTTSQPALDRFILDDAIDEATFLKESKYFDVWRFDYRYYRDILQFAKQHKIPVVALNLEHQVVADVFKNGSTDTLAPDIKVALPMDRDLDMPGYRQRLSEMHAAHVSGKHGSGFASGFIQAQGLWDESMAVNIVGFLKKQPNKQLVVLAGTEHTRKDSGIPPRVSRQLHVSQVSVINVTQKPHLTNLADVADFYFLASERQLPPRPKIGVVLAPETKDGQPVLKIEELSPHGKAKEAGLLPGDIIKEINGIAVSNMTDLSIAMLNMKIADSMPIVIVRQKDGHREEIRLTAQLSADQPSEEQP